MVQCPKQIEGLNIEPLETYGWKKKLNIELFFSGLNRKKI